MQYPNLSYTAKQENVVTCFEASGQRAKQGEEFGLILYAQKSVD